MIAPLVLSLGLALSPATGQEAELPPVEQLRELLSLDLVAEALATGLPLVGPEGALAHDGEGVALVARALALAGRDTEADALLDRARVPEADRPWIQIERARLALGRDQLERVAELVGSDATGEGTGAPVRWPERPEPWLLLGRARARGGRLAEAAPLLEHFVDAHPLDPEAPAAWHLLSRYAVEIGDHAAYETAVERAEQLARWHEVLRARSLQIRRNPDAPEPRLGLALVWMEVRELDRARAILQDLVRRAPDYARGWYHLGEVERLANRPAEAEEAYGRGIALEPDDPKLRFNRGLLRLLTGRPAEARGDFEHLVEGEAAGDARYLAAHLYLARCLVALDDLDAAGKRYERYRELGGTEPLTPPE